MPKVKPDSEAVREHEVLVNERRRHLAQAAAEEGPAVEEKSTKPELKRTESCGGRECVDSASPHVPEQTRENSIEKPEVPDRSRVQTIADSGLGGTPLSTRPRYDTFSLSPT